MMKVYSLLTPLCVNAPWFWWLLLVGFSICAVTWVAMKIRAERKQYAQWKSSVARLPFWESKTLNSPKSYLERESDLSHVLNLRGYTLPRSREEIPSMTSLEKSQGKASLIAHITQHIPKPNSGPKVKSKLSRQKKRKLSRS